VFVAYINFNLTGNTKSGSHQLKTPHI